MLDGLHCWTLADSDCIHPIDSTHLPVPSRTYLTLIPSTPSPLTGEKSPETEALREKIKTGLEQQALDFFQKEGGQVVIYDANNGVRKTRYELHEKFEKLGIHVVFLGEQKSVYYSSEESLWRRREIINDQNEMEAFISGRDETNQSLLDLCGISHVISYREHVRSRRDRRSQHPKRQAFLARRQLPTSLTTLLRRSCGVELLGSFRFVSVCSTEDGMRMLPSKTTGLESVIRNDSTNRLSSAYSSFFLPNPRRFHRSMGLASSDNRAHNLLGHLLCTIVPQM